MAGDLDVRLPGGETGREVADRFDEVLREVADAHPGETVLVVSHGGAIGLGVPAIARMDAARQRLGNCDTVERLADADGWVCTRYGADSAHSWLHPWVPQPTAESLDWCAIPPRNPESRDPPILKKIRESVIGDDQVMDGPFGPRRVTYADYTAAAAPSASSRTSSATR